MIVTQITLANLRCIRTTELYFKDDFNLLVGDNGVGKTSVIEALAVCISDYVRVANVSNRLPRRSFRVDDIRAESDSLDIDCRFINGVEKYRYVLHITRNEEPTTRTFVGDQPSSPYGEPEGRALGVLFSANRGLPSERLPPSIIGGISRAFDGALHERALQLGYFANWLRVKQTQASESSRHILNAVENAVQRFLPGYRNLHLGGTRDRTLLIQHGEVTLPVRRLSHGERSNLTIVLDLTRRLALANPSFDDPAAEAEAVVLIDEIDLHLHPKWQREIVRKLTVTFPHCQFIATTHSPQVIGEVEHDRIHILTEDGAFPPTHSFGVDSSRVLEEIMEADPRTREVLELLDRIKREIDHDAFGRAREALSQLIRRVGNDDPEVTRIRMLLEFLEEDA